MALYFPAGKTLVKQWPGSNHGGKGRFCLVYRLQAIMGEARDSTRGLETETNREIPLPACSQCLLSLLYYNLPKGSTTTVAATPHPLAIPNAPQSIGKLMQAVSQSSLSQMTLAYQENLTSTHVQTKKKQVYFSKY